MLSYRHAFHAGNHADVLKHTVIQQVITYLQLKPTPIWIIDTHAGAGLYNLSSVQAEKCREWEGGIQLLWERKDLVAPLADYVEMVKRVNSGQKLEIYPGSPAICQALLRDDDRLRLFELQADESGYLQQQFSGGAERNQIQVSRSDGFAGAKGLLPPPSRRGVVIIDPSYETPSDYRAVVTAVKDSLKKFATGVYLVWYPQLSRAESRQLPAQLRLLSPKWLDLSLTVRKTSGGFGMHGSGMFVVNPPWGLKEKMTEVLAQLASVLGENEDASYSVAFNE